MASNIFDGDIAEVNFDSSDDDVDFEGFGVEDILLGDGGVIRNMPMTNFCPVIDPNLPTDQEAGWARVDSPQANAPFTGQSKLNVEMDDKRPIDFFKLFVKDDTISNLVIQTNFVCSTAKRNRKIYVHIHVKINGYQLTLVK